MMRISQLSEITGASIRSIRHYEKKKLLTAKRLENGYRHFDQSAIKRIKEIQLYLGLGLTTDQIAEVFDCHEHEFEPDYDEFCEEMREVYDQKLSEINNKIDSLMIVKQRLEQQINKFS